MSIPFQPPSSRQPLNGLQRFPATSYNALNHRATNMTEEKAGGAGGAGDGDAGAEEDPRQTLFKAQYLQTESKISALFGDVAGVVGKRKRSEEDDKVDGNAPGGPSQNGNMERSAKRQARTIDDDYGEYDDEEEENDATATIPPVSKATVARAPPINNQHHKVPSMPTNASPERRSTTSASEQGKSSEDIRKKLEEEKKAAEDLARRSFHSMFYTLESDRDAMIEQQKLDELDRQVESEISGHGHGHTGNSTGASAQHGSLSTSNLGSSAFVLKHLIARIDAKRDQVHATDSQLRSLMQEVRKGRSKWASEENVGQEELYEAAEKTLMELKAMTEYAAPFLSAVKKREAPDYYQIIKHPMDIGTMLKKLKSCHYKSKKEFVDDLMLIWANCLKYNADPNHYLRKKALYMRKETEKLVPLIPDIIVRHRDEVEAEERRMQNGDNDNGEAEDSDDEEPIMASRGRKAPAKKSKKGASSARKAASGPADNSPAPDPKASNANLHGPTSVPHLKNDFRRADSDAPHDASVNGFATPPPGGSLTPLGAQGGGVLASQADSNEADALSSAGNGLPVGEDADHDDNEYKTWKQVTKKDRALASMERHRLFKGDKLNPDEPALLRTRADMRRYLRQQKLAMNEVPEEEHHVDVEMKDADQTAAAETLAEGMEGEGERLLPDYYDPLSGIPELNENLKWVEDSDGAVIQQNEETLRAFPQGQFISPKSALSKKMDGNMKQMQDTRKVVAKIGVVKQMSIQAQTYQNQFQKYEPEPFFEEDIPKTVVSDDGPIMAPGLCRAALHRSVAKIFYHAGFEEFQPSALEAATDIAADYFQKLVKILGVYREAPMIQVPQAEAAASGDSSQRYKPRFSHEEAILHCLHENGVDLDSLETYAKDDTERLGQKLGVMHERMKAHLADLMRPALGEQAGADGVGAFNDGSEQFVSGDFAEDIDEDFFGLRELGLEKELGLDSLNVPFHLLQNRLRNAFQAQNTSATSTTGNIMENPPAWEPVTVTSVKSQIGLAQPFFLAKLHKNNDQPLAEEEDLPQKQRFPKPRLPPTGKITSPRKRPLKEQQQMAKKKRKLEEGREEVNGVIKDGAAPSVRPLSKLKLEVPKSKEKGTDGDKEEPASHGIPGMPSPESLTA